MKKVNTIQRSGACYLLFFTLLFSGCGLKEIRKKNHFDFKNVQTVKVADNDPEDFLFVDNIVDQKSFEIYRFNEDRENMLGIIGKCITTPEGILIFDSATQAIYLYDFKGKLIRKIGGYGRGPHEYLKPLDVVYNLYSNNVEVLDMAVKCRKYNLHTGDLKFEGYNFLRKYHISYFLPTDSNKYVGYNGFSPVEEVYQNNFRFGSFVDGNVVYKNLFFAGSTQVPILAIDPFYTYNKKIHLFETTFPMIYTVEGDSLVPEYHIQYETANPTIMDPDDPLLIKEVLDQKLPMLTKVNETDHYIFINYLIGSIKRCSIYDKASAKSLGTAVFNFKIKQLDLELYSLFQDGDCLGAIVYPDGLLHTKEYLSKLSNLSPLQDQFSKLDVTALSNPVFIRFKTL